MQQTENNFNFLRILFASLVVFSHAYALLGFEEPVIFNRSLGNLSVHGFFCISGYLICKSYMRNPGLLSFFVNRFLRIVPGLFVAMLFTYTVAKLCGGFENNPVRYISNVPVWTLNWEAVCYFGLFVIGSVGLLQDRHFLGFYAAVWLAFLININGVSDFYLVIAPMVLMFLAGVFVAVVEVDSVGNKFPWFAASGLVLVFDVNIFNYLYGAIVSNVPFLWGPTVTSEQVARVIYIASFPLLVIFIGKSSNRRFVIKNDVSYGIYIYGWPIAQAIVYFAINRNVELNPIIYFVLTMLLVVPISFFSWIFVERPSLKMKRTVSRP